MPQSPSVDRDKLFPAGIGIAVFGLGTFACRRGRHPGTRQFIGARVEMKPDLLIDLARDEAGRNG